MLSLAQPLLVRLLLGAAAAILAAPVILGAALTDVEERARRLNRPLAEVPTFAEAVADPQGAVRQAIAALTDRSLGMLSASEALTRIRHDVLGDPGAETVVRNGEFVFLTDNNPVDGRQFSAIRFACRNPDDAHLWVPRLTNATRRLAGALARDGRRVSFLTVPSKPVLYHDRLPESVPFGLRQNCLRASVENAEMGAWTAALAADGIIATYPLRLMKAERDRPHFYPPENFHAVGAAAHFAAWAHLDALFPGAFPPGSVPIPPDYRAADLANVFGYRREIVRLVPQYGDRRPRYDQRRSAALSVAYPELPLIRVWRAPHSTGRGRALIIGNSFATYLDRHIAVAFDETVFAFANEVWGADLRRLLTEFVARTDPDELIFLFHDRTVKEDMFLGYRNAVLPAAGG
ncbi:MAG: hypothetical protein ACFBSD_10125 [Paracoccaceae bacterium]